MIWTALSVFIFKLDKKLKIAKFFCLKIFTFSRKASIIWLSLERWCLLALKFSRSTIMVRKISMSKAEPKKFLLIGRAKLTWPCLKMLIIPWQKTKIPSFSNSEVYPVFPTPIFLMIMIFFQIGGKFMISYFEIDDALLLYIKKDIFDVWTPTFYQLYEGLIRFDPLTKFELFKHSRTFLIRKGR